MTISIKDFTSLANQVEGDQSLRVTFGGNVAKTHILSLDSRKREAINQFVTALRTEYGDNIANMIEGSMLNGLRAAGKPLTARMVKEFVNLADTEREQVRTAQAAQAAQMALWREEVKETEIERLDLERASKGLAEAQVEHFVHSSDRVTFSTEQAENTNNLAWAVDRLCVKYKIQDEDIKAMILERVGSFLLKKAEKGGFTLDQASYEALKNGVSEGDPSYVGRFLHKKFGADALKENHPPPNPGALKDYMIKEVFVGKGQAWTHFRKELVEIKNSIGDYNGAQLAALDQCADSVTGALKSILAADDGQGALDELLKLDNFINTITADVERSRSQVIEDRRPGEPNGAGGNTNLTLFRVNAMRLGVLRFIGELGPELLGLSFARSRAFRDMIYNLRYPSQVVNAQDVEITRARRLYGELLLDMKKHVPEKTGAILEPWSVRERDLTLSRQREILALPFGTHIARVDESRPLRKSVQTNPPDKHDHMSDPIRADLLNKLEASNIPLVEEHFRQGLENDLRRGPAGEPAPKGHVSKQFIKDYTRDGMVVNGIYYHPKTTGTSVADFIALFPDADTAGRLSNIANQAFPGIYFTAMKKADNALVLVHGGMSIPMLGGTREQEMSITTLDADQGRYRISYFQSIIANRNSDSDWERYTYEISAEVNLGPNVPGLLQGRADSEVTVENVRVDFLFRGWENVPNDLLVTL
ncbi:MAG: hypothetical protein FWG97_02610 [Deltaproteobacteria bacterium]|nr:hypothetical protein [Deltaproteobacteria bacterium]